MVILSTGRTRAVTRIPFTVPDAVHGNVSFQLTVVVRAPLHCTVPVPIIAAEAIERLLPRRLVANTETTRADVRTRFFIFVFVLKNKS